MGINKKQLESLKKETLKVMVKDRDAKKKRRPTDQVIEAAKNLKLDPDMADVNRARSSGLIKLDTVAAGEEIREQTKLDENNGDSEASKTSESTKESDGDTSVTNPPPGARPPGNNGGKDPITLENIPEDLVRKIEDDILGRFKVNRVQVGPPKTNVKDATDESDVITVETSEIEGTMSRDTLSFDPAVWMIYDRLKADNPEKFGKIDKGKFASDSILAFWRDRGYVVGVIDLKSFHAEGKAGS